MRKNKQSELIKQLTKRELTFHLFVTQFILLTISIISGIFLFKDLSTFFNLFRINGSIITLGLSSGVIIVLLDTFLMKVLPSHYYDDGGINEKIFTNRSFIEIAFLAATIAICEEVLFRGVIQTNFGFIIASIIFAIIHLRYWGHWFLIVNILILSFWIGIIYELTNHNLFTTIVMHFTIDFLLGLGIKYKNRHLHS
ncbi:CPBP family glutamic-type intramembrane protease [Heyndrickxia sp. NPDC080065]|uniref:CPBP family intramembrane glutamic endopeptidase n=1 Tax=Heyndrickxia sp. NPDC080065 TaxID=3390568 RepID=UPI003D02F651